MARQDLSGQVKTRQVKTTGRQPQNNRKTTIKQLRNKTTPRQDMIRQKTRVPEPQKCLGQISQIEPVYTHTHTHIGAWLVSG
jgi:hypothetical protein